MVWKKVWVTNGDIGERVINYSIPYSSREFNDQSIKGNFSKIGSEVSSLLSFEYKENTEN